jgi:hypothetical protein
VSKSGKINSDNGSKHQKSKRSTGSKRKKGAKSHLSSEQHSQPEKFKREKELAILENQQSGNPFRADDNMYFPEGNNNRPSSKSLNNSLRSKKAKAMSSLPAIGRRDSEDGSGNAQTVKRHRVSSKRLSFNSNNKSNSSIDR